MSRTKNTKKKSLLKTIFSRPVAWYEYLFLGLGIAIGSLTLQIIDVDANGSLFSNWLMPILIFATLSIASLIRNGFGARNFTKKILFSTVAKPLLSGVAAVFLYWLFTIAIQ